MAHLPKQLRIMKRFLILLLALLPITAAAQNFHIENGQIKWQKVYDSDMTFAELHTAIVVSNDYEDIQVLDNCIMATLKPVDYIPEDYGFKYGNSNTLLLNGALGPIAVRIDVKEGKYSVSATNILITRITSGGMLPLGYKSKLEDYALKRGAPNKMMTEQFGPVFDKFLTRKTTFKKTDDDW